MREFPFLMYTADDSDVTVNAILKDETIWLSQKGMAEFQKGDTFQNMDFKAGSAGKSE